MLQTHELIPHPSHPPLAVSRVETGLSLDEGGAWLLLRWRIEGARDIVRPPFAGQRRRDGLWQTTCGELFIGGETASYREFNFSPSESWAAYDFASYRGPAGEPVLSRPPAIAWRGSGALAILDVWLPRDAMPPSACRYGLTLVIEETGGRKSYWAPAHPHDRPDFHDPACLAFRLPAPLAP